MDREALLKQLVELTEKPEVADKIKAVTNMEEMHALLRENGMEADDETLDALLTTVAHFSENEGELNDDELEDVSGGGLLWTAGRFNVDVFRVISRFIRKCQVM